MAFAKIPTPAVFFLIGLISPIFMTTRRGQDATGLKVS